MNMTHALLLLAFTSNAVAQNAPDPFARHVDAVGPGVHLIYKSKSSADAPFDGNVVAIEQNDQLVIVDAGGAPRSGENIVAAIRSISAKPVRWLIYTHYHGDHNLGAGALLKAWPDLHIVSTQATRRNMTGAPMDYIKTYDTGNQGTIDYAREQLTRTDLSDSMRKGWQHLVDAGPAMVDAYKNMKAYPADVTFGTSMTLDDASAPVEVSFFGNANTDGDAIVWLPRQRIVITGDTVVWPLPYASASYPSSWIEVLKKIDALDFATLIPGHGDVQTDHAYVRALVDTLTKIRDRVATLANGDVSVADVQKRLDTKDIVRTYAGDDEFAVFLLRAFFLHSIVENAYKEAKGQPIVQGRDGG
ncbi:MAG: MBL fold metallo-hydrolase [Rudaea sp.]